MEGFPFEHRETVRFRDLDGMGHVNNAVYSTYLEQARLAWFGPAARLGTKSFELEYELRSDGRLVAEAKSVLVGYDYATERSVEVPPRWRRRLEP